MARKSEQDQLKSFADHATQDPLWDIDRRELQKKSRIIIGNDEMLRQHRNRLICPQCERAALRCGAKDRARCSVKTCGWEGRSVTVGEYLDQKLYKG
jgi:RNase P subunit RPR2